MKYKTVTFDANRPIPQQITEPLNSDYGVAVKVYKDGQLVDADLSVDGKAAEELVDGWKTVELSSGSTPTTKMVAVDVDAPATLDETLDISAEGINNSTSRARNVAFQVDLSAITDHEITIKPEDVEVVSVRTRSASLDAEYPEWLDTSTPYCIPGALLTFMNPSWGYGTTNLLNCRQKISSKYPAEQDYTWKHVQPGVGNVVETGERTITLDTKIYIGTDYMQPQTKRQYEVVVKLNTHDGFNSRFTLLVQEKDLGYIEF